MNTSDVTIEMECQNWVLQINESIQSAKVTSDIDIDDGPHDNKKSHHIKASHEKDRNILLWETLPNNSWRIMTMAYRWNGENDNRIIITSTVRLAEKLYRHIVSSSSFCFFFYLTLVTKSWIAYLSAFNPITLYSTGESQTMFDGLRMEGLHFVRVDFSHLQSKLVTTQSLSVTISELVHPLMN